MVRFLLARLHMDALVTRRTPKIVRKALQELPSGVDETYEQTLLRINPPRETNNEEDAKYAMTLLMWMTFASRPLTVAEMEHAVTISLDTSDLTKNNMLMERVSDIDPDEVLSGGDLTSMCAGLVIVDASDKVLWVHFTTQDYFIAHSATLFPEAHLALARCCLAYLSMDPFLKGPCPEPYPVELTKRALEYPFMIYCSNNMGYHGQRAASKRLIQAILAFLRTRPLLDATHQALDHWNFLISDDAQRSETHLADVATYWGFQELIEESPRS